MSKAKNILGEALQPCCMDPITGFFRDGYCHTSPLDHGTHVVCAVMTEAFLDFTQAKGNDLRTPVPAYQFPGLKAGDTWCLCAHRWLEACDAGVAPPIKAHATHEKVLHYISLKTLEDYRMDR